MDRPWDRSSPEQELRGRRRDCTEPGTGLESRSHSSAGYTAVSGPATVGVTETERSAEGCTSGAAGIGRHTTTRTKSLVGRLGCCSGILLLVTAAPDRRSAAGRM